MRSSVARKVDVVLAFIRIYSSFFIRKLTFCAFELFERRPIVTPVVAGKKLSKFDRRTHGAFVKQPSPEVVQYKGVPAAI